jgi:hypothetical protein
MQNRRYFLMRAAQAAAAAPALQALASCAHAPQTPIGLKTDVAGALDLPEGFTYTALSKTGDTMSDGFFEPARHDGMAAFPVDGQSERCVVVRNHEVGPGARNGGAFGADYAKAASLDPGLIYDRAADGRPLLGGTTSFIFNTRTQKLEQSFLTLAGTATNCAGGPTPWGSWITCEETQEMPGANAAKMHGFNFEVPASARSPVKPIALEAMGRFKHEAIAVDPATGIVYQTEDAGDGLFYRFIPTKPGELARGGKLQALALRDQKTADTRNWGEAQIAVNQHFAVEWIDMDNVTAPDGDLRQRGAAKGAALFARGEGLCIGIENGEAVFYFACTNGGKAKRGQVWKLAPRSDGDVLSLFVESTGEAHFDMVDNLVAAPWGDIVFSEDGGGDNYVRGVTPSGHVYPIARNAMNDSEICGPCFSPDGTTLFFNVQNPGITYAVTGPWASLARAARRV